MSEPTIHFWDMDHTVIDHDCDVSWKEFMIKKGLASTDATARIDYFWNQYLTGSLNETEFIEFQLMEFSGRTEWDIQSLSEEHFDAVVKSRIYPEAKRLIDDLRLAGNTLCLITATNGVIAKPLADALGFEHLLATIPEVINGRYSGNIKGNYCGGAGKIAPIKQLCETEQTTIDNCYYYGDSVVDIPVLKAIGHAVVVNPVSELRQTAIVNGWEILEFTL